MKESALFISNKTKNIYAFYKWTGANSCLRSRIILQKGKDKGIFLHKIGK